MDDSLLDTTIQIYHIHLAAGRDSAVSVFKSRMNKLHTTRSWEFLGLNPLCGNNQGPVTSSASDVLLVSLMEVMLLNSALFCCQKHPSLNGLSLSPTSLSLQFKILIVHLLLQDLGLSQRASAILA
jgi:hypothetical protein